MQRYVKSSSLSQCSAKFMRFPRRPVVFNPRSGMRDEVAQLNAGKSPVEELSGEINTTVTDVMDIDRTPELLTWLLSGIFKGQAQQAATPSTPTDDSNITSKSDIAASQRLSTASGDSALSTAAAVEDGIGSVDPTRTTPTSHSDNMSGKVEVATVGGGCFWCIEACFRELEGVLSVTSGYAGGHVANPTYKQVCTKTTGHAEVVQIKYDSNVWSYKELLQIFLAIHDPTTPNRSGNDVGPQYRSIILTHDEGQATVAAEVLAEANRVLWFGRKICTEVVPLQTFYLAESYHQRYYERNSGAGYCVFVVRPKLQEFRRKFAKRLKREGAVDAALL